MPTAEDWEELQSYCQIEFTEGQGGYVKDGVRMNEGLRIMGPNGNSILLPITFSPHNGTTSTVLKGEYWTATAYTGDEEPGWLWAIEICFNPTNPKLEPYSNPRHDGLSIRPVMRGDNAGAYVAALVEERPTLKYSKGYIAISGHSAAGELRITDLSGRNICTLPISGDMCQLPALGKGLYVASIYNGTKAISSVKISIK